MHKLQRGEAPACLASYQHGRDRWGDLRAEHRAEIHDCLTQMQGERCAYCEGSLESLGRHIEHFRAQNAHPGCAFEWENLFFSCTREDSCGRHKDHQAGRHDPADLVKPDEEDPERFFSFSRDGTIRVRAGLSAREVIRARETLRVFNLDERHGRLRKMRQRTVDAYLAQEPDLIELLKCLSPEEREQWLQAECERTAKEPFATVIKHLLLMPGFASIDGAG